MLLMYLRATSHLRDRLQREEEGQALVEYALILSLIAVAAIVILKTLGNQVAGIFTSISNNL